MGLELGWNRETERLAGELLAAQEERYRKTGRVTIVAEDAVGVPPYYFYYYCAYTNGKHFAVDVQDPRAAVDDPRWVSAKAAFAWHALLPSGYTGLAVRTVAPARTPNGWSSGVYEASGKSTETLNINTAAVILTAVLVHARGKPLLSPSSTWRRDGQARFRVSDVPAAGVIRVAARGPGVTIANGGREAGGWIENAPSTVHGRATE
jgi:hypothetical protein